VAFTYLKVKSAKCLCLLPVVLIITPSKHYTYYLRSMTQLRFCRLHCPHPVMWSETVGLGQDRPVRDQKIGLGLASLVLCFETRSCHTRRHNDLTMSLEHHYCGDQQWRSPT